ncbi:MAG: phosphatidylserine decarboxylase [Paraglaciecola sp.]|jgi:phosphatidylserine decarboxylase
MKRYIHKEGHSILIALAVLLLIVNIAIDYFWASALPFSSVISVVLFLLVLQFFRNPVRELAMPNDDNSIIAPADGKIVAIEEVDEPEYFGDKRLQVSIFMSATNVHVNRNPIGGMVSYFKYHPGKYLMAWNPKSSTENERTTVVIDTGEVEILFRQIAGYMAKRIVSYLDEGDEVEQGKEMGFIKFGSRVDLFLPLNADVQVTIGQKVKGNKTVIAKIG